MSFKLKIISIILLISISQSYSILGEWTLKQITDYPIINQKKNKNKLISLVGQWNLVRLNSKKTNDVFNIKQSQIDLCQNKLKVKYVLSNKYSIKIEILKDNGCKIQGLQQKVLTIKFFRRNNNSLQFYDSQINLQIQLNYINQTFKNTNTSQIDSTKTTTNQSKLNIKQSEFIGQWKPLSIFGMTLEQSSVSIIFTVNRVSYVGGCNMYIFQYSIDEVQKKINIGQNKSTSNICQVNDDGLYVNALWKMTKYNFISKNKQILLTIRDATGKPLYELKKAINNEQIKQINQKLIQQNKTIQSSSLKKTGIQPARYIFLILLRRDLPRKFCTITDSKISYEGCNIIEHNYKIVNNDQIIITGNIIGNKICENNNDELLLNQFNSVKSFQKTAETGSYMLKDILNNPLINLSLF